MGNTPIIEISCCSIWTSITPYIKETTGILLDKCPTTKQSPTACVDHALMQRIVNSARPVIMNVSSNPDTYQVNTGILFTDAGMSNVLSWSFIGRTCAQDSATNVPSYYLEFNLLEETLSLTRTGCEYEKILFTSMLGICIILLVFVMVVPLMFEKKPISCEDEGSKPSISSSSIQGSYGRVPIFE